MVNEGLRERKSTKYLGRSESGRASSHSYGIIAEEDLGPEWEPL